MSHVVVVHAAEWMESNATYSIDELLTTVPRFGDDAIPDTPSFYNEYEDDWCALRTLPDDDDELAGITCPLIAVRVDRTDASRSYAFDAANRAADSTIRIQVQIAARGTSPAALGRTLSYYARCVENSLWALGFATDELRTVTGTGVRLGRVQSMQRGPLTPQKGDLLAEVVVNVVYALSESTAIPV